MIEKQYENIIKVDNAVYAETDSLITDCDMFMTIGGDGTILKWDYQFSPEVKKCIKKFSNKTRISCCTSIR